MGMTSPPDARSADRLKATLTDFLRRVWSEGDVEAAEGYVAAHYAIAHDPGDPWDGQTLDLAGFKNRVRISRASFPDQRFNIQGLYADDDTVVATWLWSGTHLGDVGPFPASGHSIRMSGATAYAFDGDERLAGHWQITDRLGVFQQLHAACAALGGPRR